MSDSSTIADGSVFAGRYQVVRCVARGGMGAIYEVIHLETQRRRALKVILPHVLESSDLRERFRLEARIAANVNSEHIVDVFDAGVDEERDMPFLVMELLKGEDLATRLGRLGKFSPDDVITYLRQTAMALDKTHGANIVHRDLKPENLYLTQRDDGTPRIKVLDFGVAKVLADGATRSAATRSIGTPLYMAPEQFASGARVSPATDIYALGMIAYTLLVGSAYFTEEAELAGNMYAFAAAIGAGPKEWPSERAKRNGVSLPAAFDTWFAAVTNPDPKQRLQPASAAIERLAIVFQDVGTEAELMPSPAAAPFAATAWAPGDRAARKSPLPAALQTPATIVSPLSDTTASESANTSQDTTEPRQTPMRSALIAAFVIAACVSVITWKVLQETPQHERNDAVTSAPSAALHSEPQPTPSPSSSSVPAPEPTVEVVPTAEPSGIASTQASALPVNTKTNAAARNVPTNTGTTTPPTPPTNTGTAPLPPPSSTTKKIDPSLKVWK